MRSLRTGIIQPVGFLLLYGIPGRAERGPVFAREQLAWEEAWPSSEPVSRFIQRKSSRCQFPLRWQSLCFVKSVGRDLEEPACWLGFQGSDKPTGTGSWQGFPSEMCQEG